MLYYLYFYNFTRNLSKMIAETFARCIGRKRMEFHIGLTNLIYNLCCFEFPNRQLLAVG